MKLFAASAIALTLVGSSQAWWDVGHKLVAAVATSHMKNAHSIEQVNNVLSYMDTLYNDEVTEWEMGNYAAQGSSRPKQESTTLVQAATWADVAKSFYNMQIFGIWHYVNIRYDPDNLNCDTSVDVDAKTQMLQLSSDIPDTYNGRQTAHWYAHFGLNFLVHMIGDVHQPYHAVARCMMYDGEVASDFGGNRWTFITPANESTNLHSWWDSGQTLWGNDLQAEIEASDPEYTEFAAALIAKYPITKLAEMGYDTDLAREEDRTRMEESIDIWLNESFNLGVDSYDAAPLNGMMEQSYADEAHLIAESRVVIGGMRLAAVLDGIFAETNFPAFDISSTSTEDAASVKSEADAAESDGGGVSTGALVGGIIGGVVVGAIIGAVAVKMIGGSKSSSANANTEESRVELS